MDIPQLKADFRPLDDTLHRWHAWALSALRWNLQRGRVVEQGRHSELLDAGGLYSRFWEKRQKARGWEVAGR